MADNNEAPSSSEKPIHERQGKEAATEQPKSDSADKDTEEKKSGGDNEGGAAPDDEGSLSADPDRKKETNAIAKGHHGDGTEGPGVKSAEEMKAAAAKAK